jgi:hypothetical protein
MRETIYLFKFIFPREQPPQDPNTDPDVPTHQKPSNFSDFFLNANQAPA